MLARSQTETTDRAAAVPHPPVGNGRAAGERLGAVGARVVFEALEKRYGEVAAVDGVSLAIGSGEFVTLLGPSGSGKTTSLMMLAGFEIPTAGEIYVDDRPIAAVPPYRRNIGMVFQSYALFPHMTVGENIAFPLRLRKLRRDEVTRKLREALELVQLPGYEGRYPRQLSGGQQQRIAVARALVFNPRVLLMDEPLGALDKQLREGLQLEIKRLHERLGVTIIYVTHDQQEALTMSDRIAVMNRGRIEQAGTPTELYDAPATRFVASFIGESNFLAGRLVGGDGRLAGVEVPGVGVVRAPARDGIAPHEDVAVTVRPEKIVFAEEAAADPAAGPLNVLDARVDEVIFVGEMRRYEVCLPGDLRLVLKRQNRAGVRQYGRGDAVRVAWHVDDGRLV
ncbi:MAG: ABC transporter ATP-binding protein [Chloroflexota bacterium]|nr:ABC transporter ATP-binding protein [Chloroflexota bacterium]